MQAQNSTHGQAPHGRALRSAHGLWSRLPIDQQLAPLCKMSSCISAICSHGIENRKGWTVAVDMACKRQHRDPLHETLEPPFDLFWVTFAAYLTGDLAGDRGFDPLGLGADPKNLAWCVLSPMRPAVRPAVCR